MKTIQFPSNTVGLLLSTVYQQLFILSFHQNKLLYISLCTYQCLAPMGEVRAYPGAIDNFQNFLSIIPTMAVCVHVNKLNALPSKLYQL